MWRMSGQETQYARRNTFTTAQRDDGGSPPRDAAVKALSTT